MIELANPASSYAAAMDSVTLIKAGKPIGVSDVDWADTLKRNKDHLLIQLAKPAFYVGFDMTQIETASV